MNLIKTNLHTTSLVLVALTFTLANATAVTRYVNIANPNPATPFTNWATAATNIQHAVDVAVAGDLVFVTNGIYQSGGLPGSRLAVSKAITVQSINGPTFTVIKGYQLPVTANGVGAVRCVFLNGNASLIGFTLTGGATDTNSASGYGGGVYCGPPGAILSNCVVVGNVAFKGGGIYSAGGIGIELAATNFNCVFSNNIAYDSGGGGFAGTYNNCLFVGNTAGSGGAVSTHSSGKVALNHCTLYGNSASVRGGGVFAASLSGRADIRVNNCIIIGNVSPVSSNYFQDAGLWITNCCTAPAPPFGLGNFTADPLFINPNAHDFRLQSGSPCINAGSFNAVSSTDLDGNPRVIGGAVDVGAYEFQSPSSVLSYAWLQRYGLPTDGSADFADSDGEGMNNYGEWRSDTIPTNALSVLRMVNATNSPTGAMVSWQSVATRSYWLERAINLGVIPRFQTLATNIAGVAGLKAYSDPTTTNGGPYFYRVGVE